MPRMITYEEYCEMMQHEYTMIKFEVYQWPFVIEITYKNDLGAMDHCCWRFDHQDICQKAASALHEREMNTHYNVSLYEASGLLDMCKIEDELKSIHNRLEHRCSVNKAAVCSYAIELKKALNELSEYITKECITELPFEFD